MTRQQSASQRFGRTLASTVLVILGALLTLVGVVYLWADDTIFNSDHFAATAVEAVRAQPVRTEISRILVNQAVDAKPELLSVRPLIETVIETALTTPVFRRVLIAGVRELHRAVFNTSEHNYALDLSNGLTIGIGRLRVVNPQLADQIPSDVTTGLVSFGKGTLVEDLSRNLERIHTLMFTLGVVGIVLLGASVAVATDRRAALVATGVTLSVGALLLLVALGAGHQFLLQQITPETTGAAAASAFDTFTALLSSWLWVVATGGVILAAVASATVRTQGAQGQVERLRQAALLVQSSTPARLIAVAGGLLLGGGLLLAPDMALSLIGRAAGLGVLYVAGTELIRISGLASSAQPSQRTLRERAQAAERSLAVRLSAIGALIVLVALGGTTLWFARANLVTAELAQADETHGCNGHVELCDRPITQVAFAGTHNSQSAADVKGFYFAEQLHGINSQLDAGVRALLIKTHYGIRAKKGVLTDLSRDTEEQHKELVENLGPDGQAAVQRLIASFGEAPKGAQAEPYLCHGFCELGAVYLDDALNDVNNFLSKHPNEVVILFFGDYVSPTDTADSFVRTGLIDRVYTHRPGTAWPTLQQMIDQDQRVLVLSEHIGDAAKPEWYHDGWSIVQDTPYAFKSRAEILTDASCAPNRGVADAPMFLVNNWVPSQTPSQAVAADVNAYDALLARVQRCQQIRGLFPNIIAVDFSEKGDLFRVVDAVNGVGESKP